MTDYNDGKWHMWYGEDMKPASVHEKSVVQYVWHDEVTGRVSVSERHAGFDEFAVGPAWVSALKFRVVKEHKEPREFWIDPNDGQVLEFDTLVSKRFIHVREVLE